MKNLRNPLTPRLLLLLALTVALPACNKKISTAGTKVKQPFSGSAYESNNRYFRGTGQGVSIKQSIARSKADLDAKNQLAAQVGTTIKAVSDQYLSQTENANAADVADKFQTLVREVMNTELADLRKIGEETYFNETTKDYTQYVAYEIKKAAMFRFMKKQARVNAKVSEQELKVMDEILDQQIKLAEAEGE
jgi:predicted DNA binding CopG/RHH family protein